MKNPVVVFVLVAVITFFGISAYNKSTNRPQSDTMMKNDQAMMPKEETVMEPTNAMMKKDDMVASPGYVQYSKMALDDASANRRVLFFFASWCPTCKPVDEEFTKNTDKIPEDVTIIRVNYNDPETDQEEKDLAKKYGVTYQHTFVQIDSAGEVVTKWNGGKLSQLLSNIK